MIVADTVEELRRSVAAARSGGRSIGFVPTMGFLHDGHLALVDEARAHAGFVVMSIFVNPLQFGPGEDLERYPRDLARDCSLAAARGVDLVFVPGAAEMYPRGDVATRVVAPELGDRLCGRFRPGHFEGVLTVVAKLFNLVQPDAAVFGRKDLQQAALVRRMVADLDFPLQVVVAPVVREADGLAMSSRNAYLSPDERAAAASLHQALLAAQAAFDAGTRDPVLIAAAARAILDAHSGVRVQYVEVVDPETLHGPHDARPGDAVAIAAFVGSTRLIDNHLLVHPGAVPERDR